MKAIFRQPSRPKWESHQTAARSRSVPIAPHHNSIRPRRLGIREVRLSQPRRLELFIGSFEVEGCHWPGCHLSSPSPCVCLRHAPRRPRASFPFANSEPLVKWLSHPWGCSSAGRAPRSQRGGQRFDPAQLHQSFNNLWHPSPAPVLRRRLRRHLRQVLQNSSAPVASRQQPHQTL
jgi:hypothetical protein